MYIKVFLKEYDLENCKAIVILINNYKTLTLSTDSESWINQQVYQKKIDHLMHAMRYTQSDIIFTVSKLSQWCQNPVVYYQTAVDWMMQYLKEMSELSIIYKREDLIDYSDSAYTDNWCNQ